MKIVGHLTPKVIKAFDLDYNPGEDITLSAQRKKHMEKHRQEFSDFDATYERIPEIIAHPDYIGRHPNGQSLEYINALRKQLHPHPYGNNRTTGVHSY